MLRHVTTRSTIRFCGSECQDLRDENERLKRQVQELERQIRTGQKAESASVCPWRQALENYIWHLEEELQSCQGEDCRISSVGELVAARYALARLHQAESSRVWESLDPSGQQYRRHVLGVIVRSLKRFLPLSLVVKAMEAGEVDRLKKR